MSQAVASPCGGGPISAAALPTYAAQCYGSLRQPVAYHPAACVADSPFVKGSVSPNQPVCCQHKTQISSCLAGSSVSMPLLSSLPTPSSWSL